jgi:hypothetical protein
MHHLLGDTVCLLLVNVARSIYGEFGLEAYSLRVQRYPAEMMGKASYGRGAGRDFAIFGVLLRKRFYNWIAERMRREAAVVRQSLLFRLALPVRVYPQAISLRSSAWLREFWHISIIRTTPLTDGIAGYPALRAGFELSHALALL